MRRAHALRTMEAPSRPASWEDLETVPDDQIGEIVDGEIVVSPRPDVPHAKTASDLGVLLGGPFRMGVGGPGGWVILDEPEIHLGPKPDKVVPDLAGWHRERMPSARGSRNRRESVESLRSSIVVVWGGGPARVPEASARVDDGARARSGAGGPSWSRLWGRAPADIPSARAHPAARSRDFRGTERPRAAAGRGCCGSARRPRRWPSRRPGSAGSWR